MKHIPLKLILQLGLPVIITALKKRHERKKQDALASTTEIKGTAVNRLLTELDEQVKEDLPPVQLELPLKVPDKISTFISNRNVAGHRLGAQHVPTKEVTNSRHSNAQRANELAKTNKHKLRKYPDYTKFTDAHLTIIHRTNYDLRVSPCEGQKPFTLAELTVVLNANLGLDKSTSAYWRVIHSDEQTPLL